MRAAKSIATVGADAHIGPLGSYEFAGGLSLIAFACRNLSGASRQLPFQGSILRPRRLGAQGGVDADELGCEL